MSAIHRREGGSLGDRHRGGAHGDISVARETLRRHGTVERAIRSLARDVEWPEDRAHESVARFPPDDNPGESALDGYVARRKRVLAAFQQGLYRPCRTPGCSGVATAPQVVCPAPECWRTRSDRSQTTPGKTL